MPPDELLYLMESGMEAIGNYDGVSRRKGARRETRLRMRVRSRNTERWRLRDCLFHRFFIAVSGVF